MAVDDDLIIKNPFGFQLVGVVVNDSVTREAVTKDQMWKFLKLVHDDNVYCKYYEVVYILFHTGMRISEFCGLTMKDIDREKRIVNIDHQLQRTSNMELVIEPTKTSSGTRKLPITEDVADMFRVIIEDRPKPKVEKMVDGYREFLFLDEDCLPLLAMHWEHRFNHMVHRYNEIYKVQIPNITPHVCRHTYCSNMAKSGMNPKNTAIPYGTLGYRRYDKRVHASWLRGCGGRTSQDGRIQKGTGGHQGKERASGFAKKVQSCIEKNFAPWLWLGGFMMQKYCVMI